MKVIDEVANGVFAKSRLTQSQVNEAKYIITVLADEIFLNIRWDGSRFWRFSLLEKQMFQSEIAGEKIFQMLDELILDTSYPNNELIFLYLMAISLGFKGKYRDYEDDGRLGWYKERLYSIIHKKSARLFYPGRSGMIESCYFYTFSDAKEKSFIPDVNFWNCTVIAIVILYIVISYVVWFSSTDQIKVLLDTISDQIRRAPLV
jgi:type VI secretion system protein ImpK